MLSIPAYRLPDVLDNLPDQFEQALLDCGEEIEILSVSGMRRGLAAGRSPDGQPFLPLAFPRPQGGNSPLRNTGLLNASLSAMCSEKELVLRANAPGARIQQFGGTIVPTKSKALTIPMTVEAVRAGGARNFPRPLFILGGTKRGDPGHAALVERTENGGLVVQYLLRTKVVVPARPYLGLSQQTLDTIAGVLSERLAELVAGSV